MNLQNIPSRPFVLSDGTKIDSGHDVRQLFTSSPGCILLSCDYSGQEVRVTAHLAHDEKMIQAYRDGKDVYSEIAALAFNTTYEECCEKRPDGTDNPAGKARRGEAKKIVLGILYGRGIPSIAEQLGKTIKEAQAIYNKVLSKFEGLAKFIQDSEEMARQYGYVTTVWGRRRQLPDMQLPYYEFKYKNGTNPNFDPLSFDNSFVNPYSSEVPEDVVRDLTNKLLNCRDYKKREQLKEQIRNEGIIIKDNGSFIAQAQRQCVNCVDLSTEILTTSGWKHYNELNENEKILSYNLNTKKIEVDVVNKIHIYDDIYEVVELKTQSFNAVATKDHKWVTEVSSSKNPKLITTEKIISHKWADYPILKISDNSFQENLEFSDAFLRLVGYSLTDGSYTKGNGSYCFRLYQTDEKPKNKRIYNEMINSLNELGLKYRDYKRNDHYHEIYIFKSDTTQKIMEMFPNGVLTDSFILSLSQRQAKIVVNTFLDCDGWDSHVVFGSKEKADMFQFLCVVSGFASNFSEKDETGVKHFGNVTNEGGYVVSKKPCYVVSVLKRKRAHLDSKHYKEHQIKGVWCVTTGNSTWIARRNGCVYITGNSQVQGSSADLTKKAQIELYNNQELRDLGFRMLIPVHDEIIAECPIENVKRCAELMSYCMKHAGADLCVPLSCDVALFYSWYGEEIDINSL